MTDDRAGQIRARLDAATPALIAAEDLLLEIGAWSDDVRAGQVEASEALDAVDDRLIPVESVAQSARATLTADLAWLLDERDRQAEIITAVTAVVDQARAEQHSSQSGRRMLGWVLDDLESALRRESS